MKEQSPIPALYFCIGPAWDCATSPPRSPLAACRPRARTARHAKSCGAVISDLQTLQRRIYSAPPEFTLKSSKPPFAKIASTRAFCTGTTQTNLFLVFKRVSFFDRQHHGPASFPLLVNTPPFPSPLGSGCAHAPSRRSRTRAHTRTRARAQTQVCSVLLPFSPFAVLLLWTVLVYPLPQPKSMSLCAVQRYAAAQHALDGQPKHEHVQPL